MDEFKPVKKNSCDYFLMVIFTTMYALIWFYLEFKLNIF